MPLRRVARYLEQQMFAYNLTTGLYMLEPWERAVFNAAVVAVVGAPRAAAPR
jgi:hypothetical protein